VPRYVRAFALKTVDSSTFAFSSIVFLTTFTASWVSLTACGLVAIVATVVALRNLVLWGESLCSVVNIIDMEAVGDTLIGHMLVVHVYDDRMV
jgi:hypothetical protein